MNIEKTLRSGFTLVEIMIVVAIIGLLAAMAIPAFNRVRNASHAKVCVNNLRQIAYARDQYFLENGGEVQVSLATLVGADAYLKSTPVCPGVGTGYTDPLTLDVEPACIGGGSDHAR